jgi:hypothetical protein
MAVISIKNKTKSGSLLVGNEAFDPGSFVPIATASPSGAATVTFSSIPQTYKALQIRFIGRLTYNGGGAIYNANINFNGDSGSNYTYHAIRATGTGVFAYSGTSQTKILLDTAFPDAGVLSNTFGVGITDIHDYSSTTKNKTVRSINGFDNNTGGNGQVWLQSGAWLNTAAITSIVITNNGGHNFASGSNFTLYGIKG